MSLGGGSQRERPSGDQRRESRSGDLRPESRSGDLRRESRSGAAQRESPSPRIEAIVDRVGAVWGRLSRVWRGLSFDRRLAAFAAIALFLTLFLPWYQETVIARGVTSLRSLSDSMTGWGAFSFVEAAILLVAAAVLALLFVRAEGEAFHVPGGDGGVITFAGGWACLLIIWRMFDKQGTSGHHLYTTSSGIEWGIFVALAVAGVLTYAGLRIRRDHEVEPPLPGEPARAAPASAPASTALSESGAAASAPAGPAYAGFEMDETWIQVERGGEEPVAADQTAATRAADQTAATRRDPAARPRRRADPAVPTRRRPRSLGTVGELDISDPPTSPLRRARPSGAERTGSERAGAREPDEPLTVRLDRPD